MARKKIAQRKIKASDYDSGHQLTVTAQCICPLLAVGWMHVYTSLGRHKYTPTCKEIQQKHRCAPKSTI